MPRVVANQSAVSQPATHPPEALLAVHRSLPGYAPTPLVPLDSLAAELGVEKVWLKDETQRIGLPSFKIMGASWAVAAAIARHLTLDSLDLGSLRASLSGSGVQLCAATDGNHGRAVARMARLLGVPCRIFVPAGLAEDRIASIASEGAEVVRGTHTYDPTVMEAADWAASERALLIQDTSWSGYEEVPRQIVLGYDTILREVDDELRLRGFGTPTLVMAQAGVGSFASAVVAHYGSGDDRPQFVSIEPDSADCVAASIKEGLPTEAAGHLDSIMAGLNCGVVSELAWPILRDGLGAAVTIDDDGAREGMRELAQAGVSAGECSGAAVGGLRLLLSDARWRERLGITSESCVLVFATEGVTEPSTYTSIVEGELGAGIRGH